jgi:predicted nucleic acid-binding protein
MFVDTSGIVALLSAGDAHHEAAVRTWKWIVGRRLRLVTTDLVLAETVVLTRARAGFDLSIAAGERLLQPPFELVSVDRPLLTEGFALYRRFAEHPLSLCDCVSFALMRRRRIRRAFTYDSHFEAVGFERAEPEDPG